MTVAALLTAKLNAYLREHHNSRPALIRMPLAMFEQLRAEMRVHLVAENKQPGAKFAGVDIEVIR